MPAVIVAVPIRWADIDGYGHVNNAAMLTLLEEARIALFWDRPGGGLLEGGPGASHQTLIANAQIDYLAPLTYAGRTAHVELWIARIGGASLEVHYRIRDHLGQECAHATTTVVQVDAATGRPARFSSSAREQAAQLLAPPLQLRQR